MKDESFKITLYSLTLTITFALLYTIIFYDTTAILLFWALISYINLPTLLIIVFFKYFFTKRRKVNSLLYVVLSSLLFLPNLFLFKYIYKDPRNIFPIFEEPYSVFFILSICSNIISYVIVKFIEYFSLKFVGNS
ncbi:NADH dehydrogenase subunit 6 [Tenacibaculum sp. 190524A05c]